MRLSISNAAIEAIRKNERIRAALLAHVTDVRSHEMEMLASATTTEGEMRFMQGRIAVLTELQGMLK